MSSITARDDPAAGEPIDLRLRTRFLARLAFPADPIQLESFGALDTGRGSPVAAPAECSFAPRSPAIARHPVQHRLIVAHNATQAKTQRPRRPKPAIKPGPAVISEPPHMRRLRLRHDPGWWGIV